jgi:hypothetical protein
MTTSTSGISSPREATSVAICMYYKIMSTQMEQTIIFVAETVKQIRDIHMQDKTTNIPHWIQPAMHILKNFHSCKMFSLTEVHLVHM